MKMERAALPCEGGADDLFYDADKKTILLSGGSGYIDIFKQNNENSYTAIAHLASQKGARTSLWIPSTHESILTVPARGGESSGLRIYRMME
jgi:hypothetical protein